MKRIYVAVAAMLIGGSAFAQTNFSGTWKLTSKEHVEGPTYGNAVSEQLSIDQRSDTFYIGSAAKTAYAQNGAEIISNDANTKRKSVRSLSWSADKKVLTLKSVIYVPDSATEIDLTRVTTYSLSADGKTLNLDRQSIETRSENWRVKAVYEKQ